MRIEKRTNEIVDRLPVKNGRVLPEGGAYFVHVMSRIVDRRFVLGDIEKEYFRKLMRSQAEFAGLRIITYALMDNHFHILLEVPEREAISDHELYRRMEAVQGRAAVTEFRQLIDRLVAQGSKRAAEAEKQQVKDRMYDLAAFMQQLKRLFTRWYNRRNNRKGTLWEARYKSVVVEGAGNPLLTMAAYIDLNAVRANLVQDPRDYRFCGYAEALAGNKRARAGLTRVTEIFGRSTDWRMVKRTYRQWLYAAGDQSKGDVEKQPFSREEVVKVWNKDGALSQNEIIKCKIRYLSDGVALGSEAFVEELFDTHRDYFSERRSSGARKWRCPSLDDFYSLRDLRIEPVS